MKYASKEGFVAARAMSSIFMVYSVSAVSTSGKVTREQERGRNSSNTYEQADNMNFSEILQQEVEERRMDSVNCHTVTYGKDSLLHRFEYRAREYN